MELFFGVSPTTYGYGPIIMFIGAIITAYGGYKTNIDRIKINKERCIENTRKTAEILVKSDDILAAIETGEKRNEETDSKLELDIKNMGADLEKSINTKIDSSNRQSEQNIKRYNELEIRRTKDSIIDEMQKLNIPESIQKYQFTKEDIDVINSFHGTSITDLFYHLDEDDVVLTINDPNHPKGFHEKRPEILSARKSSNLGEFISLLPTNIVSLIQTDSGILKYEE